MTDFETQVLKAVNGQMYVLPHNQNAKIQAAMQSLRQGGFLQKSCMNPVALETTEKGEQFANRR